MIEKIKLYFIYRKIKKRGWPKFKNFNDYLKCREWHLNYNPKDYKSEVEYDYEK